jgi:hypothetical protein
LHCATTALRIAQNPGNAAMEPGPGLLRFIGIPSTRPNLMSAPAKESIAMTEDMTEQQENHPFVHCNVPMQVTERAKHPRIPFHETRTFRCAICTESIVVTAPLPREMDLDARENAAD